MNTTIALEQPGRTLVAVAKLYRGFIIFQTLSGFAIFVNHERHNFQTVGEAKSFVDAQLMALGRLLLVGQAPLQ